MRLESSSMIVVTNTLRITGPTAMRRKEVKQLSCMESPGQYCTWALSQSILVRSEKPVAGRKELPTRYGDKSCGSTHYIERCPSTEPTFPGTPAIISSSVA